MAKYIMMVRSNPLPGRDDEYDDWYDRHALPQFVATPTIVAAQRYKLAPVEPPDYPAYEKAKHRYMVMYEIETDSLEKTKQIVWSPDNIGRIPPSPAFDASSVDCQFYLPFGRRVTKGD